MKIFAVAVACALLCSSAHTQQFIATPPTAANASVQVFFSPGSHVEQAIAGEILGARKRVWLAGYEFTSPVIARALREAYERKIDVEVVLDQSQNTDRYSSATYFHNAGVPLWINSRYPLMHHKFFVVDDETVGLGSMNFTKRGATANAENFNIFHR